MRTHLIAAFARGALALAAGGPGLKVETSDIPDPSLGGLHTFRIMPQPLYPGGIPIGSEHPLLANSTTNNALRHDIAASLIRQGFTPADSDADLVVVYYLVMPPRVDASDPDFGYPLRESWARGSGPGSVDLTPAEYADGALIIDLLDAKSGTLLWRGHGVADAAGDEREYERTLRQSVAAIVRQAPGPSMALK